MSNLCLFFHYLVWMTLVVSLMLCGVSWALAVMAIRSKDSKLIQVTFSIWFAVVHWVAGLCICYLLAF